jgi:hypothetical protein
VWSVQTKVVWAMGTGEVMRVVVVRSVFSRGASRTNTHDWPTRPYGNVRDGLVHINNTHTALEVGCMSCRIAAALVVLIVSFYLINKTSPSVSFNSFYSLTASCAQPQYFSCTD